MSARDRWDLKKRQHFISRVPWVTRLTTPVDRCDGYRRGQMPIKALSDPELREKYRCKRRGWWEFRAIPKSRRSAWGNYGSGGTYCWLHLWSAGLACGMDEDERLQAWAETQPEMGGPR